MSHEQRTPRKDVQSPELLLDETALFLHWVVTNLPVEKQRVLEAGASDYIAKPVNTDQLPSRMRVWLYR